LIYYRNSLYIFNDNFKYFVMSKIFISKYINESIQNTVSLADMLVNNAKKVEKMANELLS